MDQGRKDHDGGERYQHGDEEPRGDAGAAGYSLLGLGVAADVAVTVAIVKTPHGSLLTDDPARNRFWPPAC